MDSQVTISPSATTFDGSDATSLYRAKTLKTGLKLMGVGIKPHRSWSLKLALDAASGYTGQKYKGKKDIPRAVEDLEMWANTMLAGLPIIVKE